MSTLARPNRNIVAELKAREAAEKAAAAAQAKALQETEAQIKAAVIFGLTRILDREAAEAL